MCVGISKKAPYLGNNGEKRLRNFALGGFSGMVYMYNVPWVTNVQNCFSIVLILEAKFRWL